MDAADQLADKWSTSRRSILIAASLMLRESRGANPFNTHSKWYAANFPKEPGGKPISASTCILLLKCLSVEAQEYKRIMREDYRQRTVGKSDEEKAANLQEIQDWADRQTTATDTSSLKSVTARMISTQNQLTSLVRVQSLFANSYTNYTAAVSKH